MDQLTRFLFDGLPVRGALVRLQHAWGDLLQRRAQTQPYPEPVQRLLGEVVASSVLLQSSIRFDGKL
ncbi:MAG: Hsp33 family molecular chaperone HslO, partial [Burkholderiaceae bacterium]